MIVHVPHADPSIPSDLRQQFVLSDTELHEELARSTDWFTDELFSGGSWRMVRFPVSRLVVDAERFEDDGAEPMSAVGRGVIYLSTSGRRPLRRDIAPLERAALLERFYRPHHACLAEAVQGELDGSGSALIVDAHSFPEHPWAVESPQGAARPDFCIGTDPFHTPVALAKLAIGFLRAQGFSVLENEPYGGSIVPLEVYRKNPCVASIMVEVNRRIYMDETTGLRGPQFANIRAVITEVCHLLCGSNP